MVGKRKAAAGGSAAASTASSEGRFRLVCIYSAGRPGMQGKSTAEPSGNLVGRRSVCSGASCVAREIRREVGGFLPAALRTLLAGGRATLVAPGQEEGGRAPRGFRQLTDRLGARAPRGGRFSAAAGARGSLSRRAS